MFQDVCDGLYKASEKHNTYSCTLDLFFSLPQFLSGSSTLGILSDRVFAYIPQHVLCSKVVRSQQSFLHILIAKLLHSGILCYLICNSVLLLHDGFI